MFSYSADTFIASKQKESSIDLLEQLMKVFYLEQSSKIEQLFNKYINSYEILEELPILNIPSDQTIAIPIIPNNFSLYEAEKDIRIGFSKLPPHKVWEGELKCIPFIEHSFPANYSCKHGIDYKNVYMFFLTPYYNFEIAENHILRYLNKLIKLKVFL